MTRPGDSPVAEAPRANGISLPWRAVTGPPALAPSATAGGAAWLCAIWFGLAGSDRVFVEEGQLLQA